MILRQEIQKFSKWENSLLMAIFGKEKIIVAPQDLVFLKKKVFVLTLKSFYDKLKKENDSFSRYKILIKSIFDKMGIECYDEN